MEDKQITLQIDGHFITVPEGSTILEAATKIGINIPTLCHIDLKGTCIKNNPASCRICVVEVIGRRNLAPACATRCTEGMVVKTSTLRVMNARIPLKDVAVTVTDAGGSAIAMRLTNRSGQLDEPITVEVPDRAASLNPNTGVIPFTTVNLYARSEDYEEIFIENLQVFADTVTDQDLEMIPLSEYPDSWNKSETFLTPPQNL